MKRLINRFFNISFSIFFKRIFQIFRSGINFIKGRPFSCFVGVTSKCDCSCSHCSMADKKSKKEMTTNDFFFVFDELKKNGIFRVGLFGGEPLLRKDILKLVRYAFSIGLIVTLETNGSRLNDFAPGLKKAGIFSVAISVDSFDSKVHDSFRGKKGLFNDIFRAVRLLDKIKLPYGFSVFATNESILDGSFRKQIEFLIRKNPSFIKVNLPMMTGNWKDRKDVLVIGENYVKLKRIVSDFSNVYIEGELFSFSKRECDALKKHFFYISSNGKVFPCYVSYTSYGNLLKKGVGLREILNKMYRSDSFKCLSSKECIANQNITNKKIAK